MLHRLRTYFFPETLAARAPLRRFVSGEASYVAQRATYEFSRNTLAWYGQAAFGDARFNEAFAICRWEAFAAIAADMTVIARATLAAANVGGRLDGALVGLYAEALREYDPPLHRSAVGWTDCVEALEWAITRGSRSGRTAWQYIQDLAGRMGQTMNEPERRKPSL